MANSVAAVVRSADPDLAMDNVRTMDQVVDESLGGDRFVTYLFAGFAGVALVLAAIGIYGVMSFAVAQRTQEIGVRMALGAGTAAVLKMILREGMTLATAGLVIGLLGTYFVGQMIEIAAVRSERDRSFGCGLRRSRVDGGGTAGVLSAGAACDESRCDGGAALRVSGKLQSRKQVGICN